MEEKKLDNLDEGKDKESAENVPVENVPKDVPPIEETPVQEEPKQEDAPVEEVPAEEASKEAEDVPAEETPVQEEPKQEDVPVEEVPKEEEKPKGQPRWYVIQAMTGQEERVKQAIELTIKNEGLQDKVFQILLPTEEIVEIKGGKRVEKVKKMFPGYVFLEMVLDEESWYLIRQTPGVARFIGTKTQPTPVSGKEMQRVLKQLGKEERLEITFEKGEGVRLISGPFRGYTGTVDEVNAGKGKLKVLVNIFGRDTPVEVNFEYAQKII